MSTTDNLNIETIHALFTPNQIREEIPLTPEMAQTVVNNRAAVNNILTKKDGRFMVIVGPCSIHSQDVAMDYAKRLKALSEKVSDKLVLVMRVYFEKPRTTVGWKGYINDPALKGSSDMNAGIRGARTILSDITKLDLPIATEFLDPIVPQFISDMVSWVAIGARTTESQTHREMASGVSAAVGFKNATNGSLDVALNAMQSSKAPHHFLGIDADGKTAAVETKGNPLGHLVMRGGSDGPNFDADSVAKAEAALEKSGSFASIIMDCSHANSNKDYRRQGEVVDAVIEQKNAGNTSLVGVMLESNINEGNQSLKDDPSELDYGVSITDSCIGWETTEALVMRMYDKLQSVNA